jgi:hypothetical protein
MESKDEGLAMRAADALQKVFIRQPELVQPHTSQLVALLLTHSQKEVRWHLAQILPHLNLTKDQVKQVAQIWQDDFYNSTSSIVKTFSLQAMHDIAVHHPELQPVFDEMIAYALQNGTAAMRARAKRLLANPPDSVVI